MVAECRILLMGHCDLDFWPQFAKKVVKNGLSSVVK